MIDYSKYPPNWKTEIVPRILLRAGRVLKTIENEEGEREVIPIIDAACEECGAVNHTYNDRGAIVVLTVHHKDEDPENWDVDDDRLIALCQRCHLAKHWKWKPDKKIQFEMYQLGSPDLGR